MAKKNYAEKLKNPRWQKKRLEILERDGWKCQHCYGEENTLHVHHMTYFDGEPWECPNGLLITLCEECHKHETENRKSEESDFLEILKWQNFLSGDLYNLASGFHLLSSKYPPEVTALIIKYALTDVSTWEVICTKYFKHCAEQSKSKHSESREDEKINKPENNVGTLWEEFLRYIRKHSVMLAAKLDITGKLIECNKCRLVIGIVSHTLFVEDLMETQSLSRITELATAFFGNETVEIINVEA